MSRLNITVEGITCAGCALDVETVLGNEEGVLGVKADYSASSISVEYDPNETSENRIYSALKRIGLKILRLG